jgi:3-hydroxyisobutyrate dehydrogenase-like beta-hydroxyacid dehydrogenase
MLADDRALEEVAITGDDLARHLGPGGVHVSMSTVSPEMARKVAQHHDRFGVTYVAAPVFGRPEAAAARKLWICVSGSAAAKERVKPILEALGQGIFDMGESPAAAHVMKLVGNFWIMSAIETMAEGLAMAEKNGLDPARAVEMLGQTLFACTIYQNYGRMVLARRFEPAGFRLELGLKDVDLLLKTAGSSKVAMPAASLLHDRMVAGVAKGRGHLDWTAVVLDILEDAGLKPGP